MVLPAVVAVTLVVGAALTTAILQSIGLMPLVGQPALSLDGYTAASTDLLTSIRLSLTIAVVSTALAVLVGVTVALMATSGRRLGLAVATFTVPVPHLIGAAAIGLLLADSGFLARLFRLDEGRWPALVGGRWWIAVIAEYTWKESAFIAIVVAGTLASRVAHFDETAILLGAGRIARLRLVTLPLIAPSVLAASTITFTYSLGSYEVAQLLGRAYPEPLAVMSVRLFRSIDLATRPEAAAVAVVTAALSVAVVGVSMIALRRSSVWR